MANIEEKTRTVLKALLQCGKGPEFQEDCGDCPYVESEEHCITRFCHDAYAVIIHLDGLVQQMTDPNTVMIDKTTKSVLALRYCQTHRECYGANHECPYHNQEDCIGDMQADLLKLIDGGDAP